MANYLRVLGTENPDIHLDTIMYELEADGLKAKIAFEEGETPAKWSIIQIANDNGELLAQIERDPVTEEGGQGFEELEEFKSDILNYKPESAARWLLEYFEKVKVIYAIQMLDNAFDEGNHEIILSIQATIWSLAGGILQADYEGFSNEEGLHILWQFGDEVNGSWNMALLNDDGTWTDFQMDLGDEEQRKEFLSGTVPKNAVVM